MLRKRERGKLVRATGYVCFRPIADISTEGHVHVINWPDIMFWLPLALTIPLAAGLSLALRCKFPDWSSNVVALMAAVPGTIAVLVLGLLAYALAPIQSDLPDGGDGIIFIYVIVTLVYAVVVFSVGVVAARLCLWRATA